MLLSARRPGGPFRARASAGFTLVEVLVALLIMAVIAAMSWQGIDAIVRTRDISAARLEQQLRLQSVITQWETDLQEVQDSGVVPALEFDGASLRLTRRAADGLQLVVWSLRGDTWTRWASAPVTRNTAFQETWLRSQQLLGNETGQLRVLAGIESWQLYFWRGNAWSNAQSSAGTATSPATPGQASVAVTQPLPEGVRLLLKFSGTGGLVGTLTRDVRLKM